MNIETLGITLCTSHGTSTAHAPEAARIAPRESDSRLHGEIRVPEAPVGLVIFVAACGSAEQAARGDVDTLLLHSGHAVLTIDLLDAAACRYADATAHVPELTENLLMLLAHVQRLIDGGVIPPLPIMFFASGDATPVAVRAAAIRDKAITAVACFGGLIDLAGLQYLRVLHAPLLLQHHADDAAAAANIARARKFMEGSVEIEVLPENRILADIESARLRLAWLQRHQT
jgi:hypothetical protein